MDSRFRALALWFVAALPFAPAQSQDAGMAITGGLVFDGTGAEPRPATILVRGDRIAAVGPDVAVPPGAAVIDATGHTVLPGLFDVHTHVPYATAGRLAGDWGKHMAAYLYCGITTVVDFGSYPETFEPMRRLTATGAVAGPRLVLAARMTTPLGHGGEGGRGEFHSQEVLTPAAARAAVQRVVPYKPDVIKVFTDGWRYGSEPDMTGMEEDTLAAIVTAAHKHGIEVMTHTVTLEKAKEAARAGVDVIAHGIGNAPADQELIALMQKHGTGYAPTLAVYEQRARPTDSAIAKAVLEPQAWKSIQAPLPRRPDAWRMARVRRWDNLMKNVALLRAGGVRFATGTDAGITGTHHGWASLREMKLLVQGGMTPLEALAAATGNAARALHLDGDRGFVAPDKLADLTIVKGQPHRDIAAVDNIAYVIQGGRMVDRDALTRMIQSPEMSPMRALPAQALVDDFEAMSGRSRIDTLWVNSTDGGHDTSQMAFGRILRAPGNHAMSVRARMSHKERPYARLTVPLSKGAVEPVDAAGFKGIRFEVRGEGEYRVAVAARHVREGGPFAAPFQGDGRWRVVKIPFASLQGKAPWRRDTLQSITFEIARPAGESAWLELDNVRLYR